jgi:O-antigen/teichoic acid export membrane protein
MNIRGNVIWNLIGMVVPTIIALVSYAVLKKRVNYEEIGVVSLVLIIINISPLLDFGIGKVVTKKISAFDINSNEFKNYAMSALFANFLIGVIISLVAILVFKNLKLQAIDFVKYTHVVYFGCVIMPLMLIVNAVKSICEGAGNFEVQNKLKIVFLSLIFMVPMIVALRDYDRLVMLFLNILVIIVWVLVGVFLVLPKLSMSNIKKEILNGYIKKGLWIFISNLTAPLMQYYDRFAIGYLLGVSIVGIYSPLIDILNKSVALSVALSSIFYSGYCASLDSKKLIELDSNVKNKDLNKLLRYTNIFYFILFLFVFFFEAPLLKLWMGEDYYNLVAGVAPVFMIGVYFNSLAQYYYSYLQANENSKKIAKVHLLEAGLYVSAVYFILAYENLVYLAALSAVRAMVDLFILKNFVPSQFKKKNEILYLQDWFLEYAMVGTFIYLMCKHIL